MATHRSPSRPKTNPNLRASETQSSIRRSFTGNPFARPSVHTSPRGFVPNTPANSPAEFGQRLKDGSLRGFEEKENEKVVNFKAMKCKSPLRTSKNFMSPTISAASKFTPSPRKKILGERNEAIRTSLSSSFSDDQESSVSDFDTKSEIEINHGLTEGACDFTGFNEREVLKAPSIPKVLKRVTFSDEVLPIDQCQVSETPSKADKQEDYDSVILDSSLDLGLSSSPAIATVNDDTPYDPKTNYLSPRPQFLRYKPNRRIEAYLNKEGLNIEETKEVEDSDVTEESEYEDSQKESEEGSTTEPSSSEEEALPIKQIFEARSAPKQGFFTRSKCISLLLLFLVACVSVSISDVSITSPPAIKDTSFYKFYNSFEVAALARKNVDQLMVLAGNFHHWYESSEIVASARENFDGLLRKFEQWYDSTDIASFARDFKLYSFQTMSYLSKLISRTGKVDKSSSVEFCNLTDSQEHSVNVGYFEANGQKKVAEILDQYELKTMEEDGRDYLEEKAHSANIFNEQKEELKFSDQYELKTMLKEEAVRDFLEEKAHSANVFNEQNKEVSDVQTMIQAEINYFEIAPEVLDLEEIETELQSNIESEDQIADVNEHDEEEPKSQKMILAESDTAEVFDLEQLDTELQSNTESEDQSVLESPASEAQSEVEAPEVITLNKFATDLISEKKQYVHAVLGISVVILAAMAASAFVYHKQGKNNTAVNDPVVHVEPQQSKKLVLCQTPSHQDSSQNSPTNSVMCGESSCPSTSYNKTSIKRMNKRESLESSSEFSTDSPSYGSFTTYERIPLKQVSRDEDIMTPVRRSSRIRSKFTSP